MTLLTLHPGTLSLADLRRFDAASAPGGLSLSALAGANIARAHDCLQGLIAGGGLIYGVNTGFGPLSNQRIGADQLAGLQRRMVLSNAAGTGAALEERIVRRAMLLKLATFCQGASGVSPALAERLLVMLNEGITPVVPGKGSVGASGDLAPLAHIGAALIGTGEVVQGGTRKPAAAAFAALGLSPFVLGPKEGLALVNGTQVSTALAIEGLFRLEELFRAGLLIGALTVLAGAGSSGAFDPRIHSLRNQRGQAGVARLLRHLTLTGRDPEHQGGIRVQDPYCLRCQPQVMGPVLDNLRHAARVLTREINGVTDNPLIDVATGDLLYGGNFHAQAIGTAADLMALCFAETGSISERRSAFLVDPAQSGLPAFLAPPGGLDSGLMVAQVTAAALASENKFLANAASSDSIPTAANLEDYVSMATHAARRLGDIAENARDILAIELIAACQGIDLRGQGRPSGSLGVVYERVRAEIAPWDEDRFLAPEIARAAGLIEAGLPTGRDGIPPESWPDLPSLAA